MKNGSLREYDPEKDGEFIPEPPLPALLVVTPDGIKP